MEYKKDNNNDFFDAKNNSHLDDIDEFFYRHFPDLIGEHSFIEKEQINETNKIEVLDIEDNDLLELKSNEKETEVLTFDNCSNTEILELKCNEKETEVLIFDNYSSIEILELETEKEKIDILDFNDDKEAEIINFETSAINIESQNKETERDIEILEIDNFETIGQEIINISIENIEENDQSNFNETLENNKKIINKLNIKKTVLIVILILLLILLLFVGYKIFKWNLNNKSIDKQIDEIQSSTIVEEVVDNENTVIIDTNVNQDENQNNTQTIDKNNDYWNFIKQPLISVDFSELLEKNSDTVGWLQVNGTNINYPVVQYTDNSYYLTHSFDKTYNDAGWVFVDFRNNLTNDKNMIIYGHSRLNSTMFGTLKNVVKSSWYKNRSNHLIKMSTINSNTSWQVFSTYIIDEEDYYIKTDFNTNEEYLKFLQTLKSRSVYNYNINVNENDRIITLSTCYTNNKRVVLHAKLIKIENR